jgi:hypothetical protein
LCFGHHDLVLLEAMGSMAMIDDKGLIRRNGDDAAAAVNDDDDDDTTVE